MRLQAKYNRATISAAIFVLIVASTGYYFLIKYALINLVDEALKVEEQEIIEHIRTYNELPEASHFRDQRIEFTAALRPEKRQFVSRRVFSPAENENEISRQLIFPVSVNDKVYTVIVTKSQAEAQDLLMLILFTTFAVILLLLAILFIANRILLKKLWRPFYLALSEMKDFNLSNPKKIALNKSNIDEFNALNEAWTQTTEKINHDYESLKAFADNASHEMQTPLAIINSKLDLLIQDQQLNEKNMHSLQAIYDALDKLTKLNQSLLLLAKIGNKQFSEKQTIEFSDLLKERLSQLEELIQSKHLSVTTDLKKLSVSINPLLADILINNLLVNAIRHNIISGKISILTEHHTIRISNTANGNSLDRESVFHRFEKSNESDGIGLGLAIVKQICDTYNFHVDYAFGEGFHTFQIRF